MGIYNQFGWEGIRFIFWDNNAGRISGKLKGNSTDYFFYFHTALYIFLPRGLLFFIALFFEFKEQFKRKWKIAETEELFSLGGITLCWIIISIARAKAPHYFMVISPFMAILSAKWIIRFFKDASFLKMKKTVTIIQYVTISGTWILFFTLCIFWFPAKSILFWSAIIILIGLLFIPTKKNQMVLIIRRSVITIIAINFALNIHVFPQIFTYQSTIPACTIFNEQAAEGEMLNTYLSEHRELFFYAKNPGHFLYTSNDLQKRLSYSGDWIYTNDEGLEEIKELGTKIKVVKSFKHRSVFKFTGKFMNPATRNQSLKNMHLIKIL